MNKLFSISSLTQSLTQPLTQSIIAIALLSSALPANANHVIKGSFEYNINDEELSKWELGPVFSLSESEDLELEIPIGQDDGIWFMQPELTHEIDINDFSLEFSVGVEIPFNDDPIEHFGSIEGSVDF